MAKIRIDGSRTQTIRTILIACLAAFAVVLLAVFGVKQLAHRGIRLDLPGQLKSNVSQTADGFTFSQSLRGHTLFTIHASNVVEFKGDRAELRNVDITLYGPAGSNRRDHITGSDFIYDKAAGTVVARGRVRIDLSSPPAKARKRRSAPERPAGIHIETSGLRFDQKSGEATTDQPLSFRLPRVSGKAVGGAYDSKTGVLVLQKSVELEAEQSGTPAVVKAEHAQLLRDSHVAYLIRAQSEYQGSRESADQVILHFRPDGSIENLNAQNHVRMVGAEGGELDASTTTASFNEQGDLLGAHAGGGVNFVSDSEQTAMHGNAVQGTLVFAQGKDGKATLRQAHFRNAVSFVLQQKSLGGDPRASATREITATRLDISFVPGPKGQALGQKAVAQGGATVDLHDLPYGKPPRHSTIHGETLVALLKDGRMLRSLNGSGGTKLVNYAPDGAKETSSGDLLDVEFKPTARTRRAPGEPSLVEGESAEILTATQRGHVTMVAEPDRLAKPKNKEPEQTLYASAGMAVYRSANASADEKVELTGGDSHPPEVHNATLTVTARVIDYSRQSGEATAIGDVRSSYRMKPTTGQSFEGRSAARGKDVQASKNSQAPGLGGAGAVHVVGESAVLSKETGAVTFDGNAGSPARIWQGANSVTAPVLELGKRQGSLDAHGAKQQQGAVHAVFQGKEASHIAADTLFYSDTTRMGDFRGHVTLQQGATTARAENAQVFLGEAAPGAASQLERITASGGVVVTGRGSRGTGAKLVYTASDGNIALTGTPGALPRATSAQNGTVTGAELLFRGTDGSVEVLSRDAAGNSAQTVTDTEAKATTQAGAKQ